MLRCWELGNIPLGLYADEAMFGYEAYSILKTGHDHHGNFLPIFFQAYGSYVNGLYYYCAVPFIAVLGPTITAVRLTSVALGILAVFFTYKVASLYVNRLTALIAAFLLAVAPWHIQYSRIAMDPISGPAFFIMGFYFFASGFRERNRRRLVLSAIPVGLSLYTYAVARLFVPLFFLLFALLHLKECWSQRKALRIWLLLVVAMCLPMIPAYTSGVLTERFASFSIFQDEDLREEQQAKLKEAGYTTVADTPLLLQASLFFRQYHKHTSLDFYLRSGDSNERHHVQQRGQLLWFTFVMMLVGCAAVVYRREKELLLFPLWWLLSPLPASLTNEGIPHAGRCILGLGSFEILAALGVMSVFQLVASCRLVKGGRLAQQILLGVFLASVAYGVHDLVRYVRRYFTEFPIYSAEGHEYHVRAVHEATKDLRGYDGFLLPFDFHTESFAYLRQTDPRVFLSHDSVHEHVPYGTHWIPSELLEGSRLLYVVVPDTYQDFKKIGTVYHQLTGEVLYEIRQPPPGFRAGAETPDDEERLRALQEK